MSNEPAAFTSTLDRLAADAEDGGCHAPRISGDAYLPRQARTHSHPTPEAARLVAAAYGAWQAAHAAPAGHEDFQDAEAALAATTDLSRLKALRRRLARRLHPDLVADGHKTVAEDLMRKLNGAIDTARSRAARAG